MQRRSTRREFLGRTTTATIAGASAAGVFAIGRAGAAPSETINLGLIGCGTRGGPLIDIFKSLPGTRVTAVCDLHAARLAAARNRAGGDAVAAYHDYRKLLDDKNVDAVIVATNGHWKALPTIGACQAGKDVYVEKPLATSIGEGRAIVDAAEKYGRIVQIGTQQHSTDRYREAVEIVQSGQLGRISEVKVWDYVNQNPGFGNPPDGDPPPHLDWDFWLGPSPKVPFNPNRYSEHYWFFDYGGAWTVDWAVHHYDIVHWAMGVEAPTTAMAAGGHYAFDDNRDWPDTFSGVVEYGPCPAAEQGFVLQYTYRAANQAERYPASNGKCFHGTDATLLVHRGGYTLTPELRGGKKVKPRQLTSEPATDGPHQQAFLDHVRGRTRPETDALVGHRASNPGHLMNIAWRVGRKIRWDAENEQIHDDPEANALLTKEYRAPWKLEV